ncbi:hypothetical protein QQX09_03205 [Demequina sp. SYSU T00192]|uniref:Uncharacterized protein n=1 Tax=Demequina litoralis TaxID=3051660 RepID=A0ABT8G6V8_9MICO|nr:hypothetical protein [Demequina sp. SYSU T00192]MDN4474861.1 hypothetical protein [Demequina sp. SYSU T00192]
MTEQYDADTEALVELTAEVEREREAEAADYDSSVDPEDEIDEEAPADGPVEPLDDAPEAEGGDEARYL